MERREFVRVAAGVAAVGVTGCTGNGEDNKRDEGPETAGFGYDTWVPSAGYRRVGYADVSGLLDADAVSPDRSEGIAGGAELSFSDVDEYVSTDGGTGLEAFSGSFEAEELTEEVTEGLDDTEESEYVGHTVVEGQNDDGEGVGVAVSDSTVVSAGEDGATRVLDAAVGDVPRHADADDLMGEVSEYAEDPLVVVFEYDFGNVVYRFVEESDDGFVFVEVARLPDEQAARGYEYPGEQYDDVTVERDGADVTIETEETADGVESLFFGSGEMFP